jgi:ribose transport system ATP-binding protein
MRSVTLEVKSVYKQFSGVEVLKDVNLEAASGAVLGVVGINGAGKTTLMNIIAGEVALDEGSLLIDGEEVSIQSPKDAEKFGIALIHQEPVDFAHMSVAENIYLSDLPLFKGFPLIQRRKMEKQAREQLQRLGSNLNPGSRLSELSIGGRQQVAVARALAQNARIFLFDEPTSSLSFKEKQYLFDLIGRLKQRGATIIYITHFLDEVLQICDKVCILRDGRVASSGPIRNYKLQDVIHEMIGRDLASFEHRQSGGDRRELLRVEGLSAGNLVRNVSFSINSGEVLGIWGLMGSGRTELVRALLGLYPVTAGKLLVPDGMAMRQISGRQLLHSCGYVTETRHDDGLFLPQAVWWNISSAFLKAFEKQPFFAMDVRKEMDAGKTMAERLQIQMPGVAYPVRQLSGGNQQKVVLAKWLLRQPEIYFMDEPTRGVDVGAKREIQNTIRDLVSEGAGILLISSEIEEMMSLSDRIIVLRGGTAVQEVPYAEFSKEHLMSLGVGNGSEK